MASIKHCDRCSKAIDLPNEIGVVLEVSKFVTTRRYIRPANKLLEAIKQEGMEYLPFEFNEEKFDKLDLCDACFSDFMKLKTVN
jgi:hypothetical protein